MKVLLCEDIEKLGWLGDVVEVNEGYARNYLLPQRLAKPATETAIRAIADEKAKRAEQRKLEGRRLQAAAEAVNGAEAVVAAKANEQGHLFGSVSAREIAANLRSQGFEVADEIVQLPDHIKQVGTHAVTLRFAADVTATVNVVVVPEKDTQGAEKSTPETDET
ncbi:MAG: 50S ribosomal protein L9 [Planctomycetes bacterium RBG_16_55_9]|nr:MAG: 50S ribosomal protein L9 [Planctomycetes bacterium RBG_16_55_9]